MFLGCIEVNIGWKWVKICNTESSKIKYGTVSVKYTKV